MSERDSEVKAVAAVLRRTSWPLDGHGRYASIPADQVGDAASRLYSAGLRALTPLAPEVPPPDVPARSIVPDEPDSPMAWALRVGCGAFTVKDDSGVLCTMALGDINSVARRIQADLDRLVVAATRTPEPPDSAGPTTLAVALAAARMLAEPTVDRNGDAPDPLVAISGLAGYLDVDATVTLPMPVFAVIRQLASEALGARDRYAANGWAMTPIPQEAAVRSALRSGSPPRKAASR